MNESDPVVLKFGLTLQQIIDVVSITNIQINTYIISLSTVQSTFAGTTATSSIKSEVDDIVLHFYTSFAFTI